MFTLEAYFAKICTRQAWGFVGLKDSLATLSDIKDLRLEQTYSTFLALKPVLLTDSKLFITQDSQTKVENPFITEGDTRYCQGTLLILQKVVPTALDGTETYPFEEYDSLTELSQTLKTLFYKDVRINLGAVVSLLQSESITHEIAFFFPVTNSFGV